MYFCTGPLLESRAAETVTPNGLHCIPVNHLMTKSCPESHTQSEDEEFSGTLEQQFKRERTERVNSWPLYFISCASCTMYLRCNSNIIAPPLWRFADLFRCTSWNPLNSYSVTTITLTINVRCNKTLLIQIVTEWVPISLIFFLGYTRPCHIRRNLGEMSLYTEDTFQTPIQCESR